MKYTDIKEQMPQKRYVAYKLKNAVSYFESLNYRKDLYKDLKKLSNEIAVCTTRAGVLICKGCSTKYFDRSRQSYCQNRLCPVCARRRSLKYMKLLLPVFEDLLSKGYVINFLTLTIKDTEVLNKGLKLLNDSWREMTHEDKFLSNLFKKLFVGGLRNIEVKKGEYSKLWHPHMHILVVKKDYSRDYDYIKSLWEHATSKVAKTKQKVGSVHIEAIKTESGSVYKGFKSTKLKDGTRVVSNELKQALLKAVAELVKYITKFNFEDYSNEDINELIYSTKNKRFMNAFGILYNLQKEIEKDCEDIDEDEETMKEHICKHCGCTEFYLDSVLTESVDTLEEFE